MDMKKVLAVVLEEVRHGRRSGWIYCPVCASGRLGYFVSYAGRVHGLCTRAGCVNLKARMEESDGYKSGSGIGTGAADVAAVAVGGEAEGGVGETGGPEAGGPGGPASGGEA